MLDQTRFVTGTQQKGPDGAGKALCPPITPSMQMKSAVKTRVAAYTHRRNARAHCQTGFATASPNSQLDRLPDQGCVTQH